MAAIIKRQREYFFTVANEICGKYSKEALKTWENLVKKYLIENASTELLAIIIANDNWVEFTIRYMVDYLKRRSTKDKLFSRIPEETGKSGSEIRFASSTVQLVNTPEMHVKTKDEKNII